MVASGFTSIVDVTFGQNGSVYVVEIDEASAAAIELGVGGQGGTVNKCSFPGWTCNAVATGLTIPIAAAVDRSGTVFVAVSALVSGAAKVIALP